MSAQYFKRTTEKGELAYFIADTEEDGDTLKRIFDDLEEITEEEIDDLLDESAYVTAVWDTRELIGRYILEEI